MMTANETKTMTVSGYRGSREFKVERNERGHWLLTGKRGAVYVAIPFHNQDGPEIRFFLMSTTRVDPMGEDVVLVERDGELMQAHTMGRAVLVERDGTAAIR